MMLVALNTQHELFQLDRDDSTQRSSTGGGTQRRRALATTSVPPSTSAGNTKNEARSKLESYKKLVADGQHSDASRLPAAARSKMETEVTDAIIDYENAAQLWRARSSTPSTSPSAEPPKTNDGSKSARTGSAFFAVGSSERDVVRVLGTPTSISRGKDFDTWYFGQSKVTFKSRSVAEWRVLDSGFSARVDLSSGRTTESVESKDGSGKEAERKPPRSAATKPSRIVIQAESTGAERPSKHGRTSAEIRSILIQQSIARYRGSCPCPYNLDRAGRRCGRRSAYSRAGGASPLCYESDISTRTVSDFRDRN